MKKILTIMGIMCLGLSSVLAQTVQVSGTVTGAEEGQPLPGVTVVVKGTLQGTVTNVNGKYSLNVPANASLQFSFVGMVSQEIDVDGRQVIDVVMETDTRAIEEVVVTALGLSRERKVLTYAVSSYDNEELTIAGQRSALNSLQGKVPGVSITSNSGAPGASSRIVLRGYSSFAGNNEPLFVVDGMPISNNASQNRGRGGNILYNTVDFGNSANDINPNDIENISILKGAAASALYGSRAANGVVLITTKSGSAVDKIKVDYIGSVKFTYYMPVLKYQNEWGQGWSGHFYYDENGSWGPKFDGKERLWGRVIDNQQQYKPFVGQPTNIQDFYQTGVTWSNSISISGGNDKATYYVSYQNISDDGIVPTDVDSYSKNSFNFSGAYKGSFMTVSSNVAYNQKKVSVVGGGQGYSVFNNIMQIPRDFSIIDMADYTNKFYDINGYYTSYGIVNPYWTLNEDGNEFDEDHVYGNVKVEVPIYKTLKFTARLGNDFYTNRRKEWVAIIQPDEWSPNFGDTKDAGSVYVSNGYRSELNLDAYLTYDTKFFNDFSLNAMFGYNLNTRYTNTQSTDVIGLDLPGFYSVKNTSGTPTVAQTYTQRRLIGLFGQVDIGYKDMLYLNVSARNDWSSTLPKDGNNYFYPAVGVSWLLSETFPSIQNVLSFGKLRAGYGVTGNDADPYALMSVMTTGLISMPFGPGVTFPFRGLNAYEVGNTIGNSTLQPEMTHELEIGADLRFLNNRIGLDVAWYKRNTKQLLLNVDIPTSTGYTVAWMNLGNVQNQGFEIHAKGTPVQTKDLTWDLGVTFTKNNNKVIEMLPGLLDEIQIGGFGGTGIYASAGKPMGYFRATGVAKTDDGKTIVSPNGVPITSASQVYGSFQHDYTMGFTTMVNYKGLYLSAAFDFRKGGLFFSRTADINDFVGNNIRTAYNDRRPFVVPNSVRELKDAGGKTIYVENTTPIAAENVSTFYNNGGFDGAASDLIDKTSFRAREIVLGYRLPKPLYQRTPISNIEVSVIGYNLFLWLPKSNTFIDPDVTTFGNRIGGEFGEFSAYPGTRSWAISLKISL